MDADEALLRAFNLGMDDAGWTDEVMVEAELLLPTLVCGWIRRDYAHHERLERRLAPVFGDDARAANAAGMNRSPFPPPRPLSRAVLHSLIFGGVSAALSAADGDGVGASVGLGFVIAAIALAAYLSAWLDAASNDSWLRQCSGMTPENGLAQFDVS